MPIHNRTFFILSLMTLFALFIRLQYVQQTIIDQPIRADARQYVIYGYNLYAHGVFSKEINADTPKSDSFRSPGYPIFLSLAFLLGGERGYYSIIIYGQIVLSVFLVPLTFWTGMRFLSRFQSFLAAALVTLSPHLIAMTSYVLTETLFAFLLLSSVFVYFIAWEKKRLTYVLISGLLSGAAYLTNETFLFLPFLFFIYFYGWFYRRDMVRARETESGKKPMIHMTVYLIIFSLFPLAWTLRNQNIDSDPSKATGRAVLSLSHGAYPDFVYKDKNYKYYPYLEDPRQPAFGSSLGSFLEILGERFRENPARYLIWYLVKKPYYLWSWDNLQSRMGEACDKGEGDVYVYKVMTSLYYQSPSANLSRIAMKYLHLPILAVSLVGGLCFLCTLFSGKSGGRDNIYPGLIFIVIIYYTLLYMIFASWPRYSVPLRPELYLFALWSARKATAWLKIRFV